MDCRGDARFGSQGREGFVKMKEIPIAKVLYEEVCSEGAMGGEGVVEDRGFFACVNEHPIGVPLDRIFDEFKVNIGSAPDDVISANAVEMYKRFRLWLIPHFVSLIRKKGKAEPTAVGIEVEYLHEGNTVSTVALIPCAQFIEHGKFDASIGFSGEVEHRFGNDSGAPKAREFAGLKFVAHGGAGLCLRISADVITPYVAAIGKGSALCQWRFDKKNEALFGRDIETWSIVALHKTQKSLRYRAKFYFDSRVFILSRRTESDWVEVDCTLD